MEKIVLSVLQKMNIDDYLNNTQVEQIKYSIMAIIGDLSKFLMLLFLFTLLSESQYFLYAFLTTTLLRILIGGIHFKTYWKCLLFSTGYYSLLIYLCSYTTGMTIVVTASISSIIILLLAPQLPKKSKRILMVNVWKTKLFAMTLTLCYSLLYIIIKDPIFTLGPLTIIFQSIQLLIMKGGNFHENLKKAHIVP